MFKKLLIVLLLAVAGVLLYAATRPDHFSLQRSATIGAPPERLFALINDVHAFNTWNPWAQKDPAAKMQYEGPASGPGAAYAWASDTLGVGRSEIVEAVPPRLVVLRLSFEKPMQATNRVEFTLVPDGPATRVTWAMSGPMPYLSKLMTVFFSFEKMVGPDFEAGLANLKALAEKG
ncbi:MAG: SRPBCC family protein [Piscinibacter sp.]|nr:SRPBCC family protein [Piscinibacter sp.]